MALVAGLGLLAMTIAAPVAVFGLLPNGRPVGAGVILLGVAVLDVIVSFALHACFGARNRRWSLLAATLRVVYALMLFAAVRHLLVSPPDFEREWTIALGVFGLHLLVLGAVIAQRGGSFCVLGGLVLAAGAGYALDGLAMLTVQHAFGVASVTFVGEVVLMFWLLRWGVQSNDAVRESAAQPTGATEVKPATTTRHMKKERVGAR
jgi:hypothetical protein